MAHYGGLCDLGYLGYLGFRYQNIWVREAGHRASDGGAEYGPRMPRGARNVRNPGK